MPSSVASLLASQDLIVDDSVRWGQTVDTVSPGIYVVSLSDDPTDAGKGAQDEPDIDLGAVERWIEEAPCLLVDGHRPAPVELATRISEFWLPDETILYIGITTRALRRRLSQFYRTRLGRSSPHRGGQWLKTLTDLNDLRVFYTAAPPGDLESLEETLIDEFAGDVSRASKARTRDPSHPYPWANLENRKRKQHGVTGMAGG